jgi:hypothetical protein
MVVVGLIVALLPAVICAILLAALRAWRPGSERQLTWAVPLAVGVGFIAAQAIVDGAPRLPAIEASGWFSLIAAVLTLIAIVVHPRLKGVAWASVSTVVVAAVVLLIAWPLLVQGQADSVVPLVVRLVAMTAVAAIVAWLVDRHAAPGPGAPVVLLVAATGVATAMALCGSARYGQIAGAVASVMGPLALLGFLRRETRLLGGAAWMSYMLLAMMLIAGYIWVDVPVFVTLLLALAPLGLLAGELPMLRDGSFWKRDGVRVVVTVAIVSIALAVAFASASDSASY